MLHLTCLRGDSTALQGCSLPGPLSFEPPPQPSPNLLNSCASVCSAWEQSGSRTLDSPSAAAGLEGPLDSPPSPPPPADFY